MDSIVRYVTEKREVNNAAVWVIVDQWHHDVVIATICDGSPYVHSFMHLAELANVGIESVIATAVSSCVETIKDLGTPQNN